MDKIDKKILALLQSDASVTVTHIADRVNISKAACCRRIQRLQDDGVILGTVALLNAKQLNVGTTIYVMVKTSNHTAAWVERFLQAVRETPEITEIYRMSGEIDYLLRICVPNVDAYGVVYKRLISALELLDVSASFALETLKYTTALPLAYL